MSTENLNANSLLRMPSKNPYGHNTQANPSDILLEIVSTAKLFHTADYEGYADINVNDRRETWAIRSKGFSDWLTRTYFNETKQIPTRNALEGALLLAEAKARYDAPLRNVYLRVAESNGCYYIDLADEDWRVIEINQNGWKIVKNAPVRFYRSSNMKPIPLPQSGGNIDALCRYINLQNEDDFKLLVSWILAALRPIGPYPVLVINGSQGSAKSTLTSILKALIDPNKADRRTLPKTAQDFYVAAKNSYVLAFDNISYLSKEASDTLCRLSTGASFGTRQLYTTTEEIVIEAVRPIILNSIEDVVDQPDLADRAIFISLEPIAKNDRRSEAELWNSIQRDLPQILGALLDGLVVGIERLPTLKPVWLPRMADFASWASACEVQYWSESEFLRAFRRNEMKTLENFASTEPVIFGLRILLTSQTSLTIKATDLLQELKRACGNARDGLPNNAKALGNKLNILQPLLKKLGITFVRNRTGLTGERILTINKDENYLKFEGGNQ